VNPRALVPQSIMPGYPFLQKNDLDADDIANHLKANRMGGVPYTDEMIANAARDLKAQVNPDDPGAADLEKRYGRVQVRDFDGNPQKLSEADALIAYLQILGTMVDFKGYDAKANYR
jgi:cytochrome c oxidase cbb3-type subunit 2